MRCSPNTIRDSLILGVKKPVFGSRKGSTAAGRQAEPQLLVSLSGVIYVAELPGRFSGRRGGLAAGQVLLPPVQIFDLAAFNFPLNPLASACLGLPRE
jgi:hypothetical protein